MPNGRTGGFLIAPDHLAQLLREFSSETSIGKDSHSVVTVSDALHLVETHKESPQQNGRAVGGTSRLRDSLT